MMLAETGLIGMVGKAEEAWARAGIYQKHGAVYLMAGRCGLSGIKSYPLGPDCCVWIWGMEAIREFEVEDMPADRSRGQYRPIGSPLPDRLSGGKNRRPKTTELRG